MGLAEGMVQSEELALSNIATKNYKNHKIVENNSHENAIGLQYSMQVSR